MLLGDERGGLSGLSFFAGMRATVRGDGRGKKIGFSWQEQGCLPPAQCHARGVELLESDCSTPTAFHTFPLSPFRLDLLGCCAHLEWGVESASGVGVWRQVKMAKNSMNLTQVSGQRGMQTDRRQSLKTWFVGLFVNAESMGGGADASMAFGLN